jgi:hypothetical protein
MSCFVRLGETPDLIISIVQLLSLFTPLSNGRGGGKTGKFIMNLRPWMQGGILLVPIAWNHPI